jgi:hypothetical protein
MTLGRMLSPGTRVGQYEIVRALGAGGMGEVYRARDPKLGRDVAIKVLPAEFASRPDALPRFEREARAVAALSHPNILAIHDFGVADGTAFAVMELVEGETLREALSHGPLPVRRAIACAVQVAQGLAAAHDRDIVHRDLKPENLMVTADGRVKILDFGLARQDGSGAEASGTLAQTVQSPTGPGVLLGTVGYMSPEQVRGVTADARADIFSLGAVLYEMVTGARPFHRETAAESMTAILREDPPEIPADRAIPPAVDRIIRHCLEKKPEARFRSAHDLAFALETVSGSSSSGSSPALAADTDSPQRRPGWLALLAGAGALVAVFAGGMMLGRSRNAADRAGIPSGPPTFRRLTFEQGLIYGARFAPDGQTIVYSAGALAEESRLFLTRLESPGATPLATPRAVLFSISPTAEMAVGIDASPVSEGIAEGTLVQSPMMGGATRRVADRVRFADWSPDGSSMAIVRVAGSRQRLEYPVGTVLFETDGEIGFPRIAPGGDRVAFIEWPVKNDDRGTVVIVDRSGVKRTISRALEGVRSVVWPPGGGEVWYSAANVASEYSIWASTLDGIERRVLSGPGGLLILDFNRDGRALVADYTRGSRISAVFAGETVERDLSWMDSSFARDVTADGRRILLSYNGVSSSPSYDVFVRDRDGEAVRIGEGEAQQFSPDGRFALSVVHGPPVKLQVLPVAAGSARDVPTGPVTPTNARWLPDGQRLILIGTEAGRGQRAYVAGLDGSSPRAISPEGVTFRSNALEVSPDGAWVALRSIEGRFMLYPVEGGEPRPVAGLEGNEAVIGWASDGRAVLVGPDSGPIRRLSRVDPATGRRETFRDFTPPEPQLRGPSQVMLTPDGKTLVTNYGRVRMTLYLVEGLK